MALLNNRKGLAGAKAKIINNPFVVEGTNSLWEADGEVDIRVEDTIIGCVRAFNADKPHSFSQEFVNWNKVIRLYRNVNVLSRPTIQAYLRCSESQAKRYVRVIKLANMFLTTLINERLSSITQGYVSVTREQGRDDYLYLMQRKQKPLTEVCTLILHATK